MKHIKSSLFRGAETWRLTERNRRKDEGVEKDTKNQLGIEVSVAARRPAKATDLVWAC